MALRMVRLRVSSSCFALASRIRALSAWKKRPISPHQAASAALRTHASHSASSFSIWQNSCAGWLPRRGISRPMA